MLSPLSHFYIPSSQQVGKKQNVIQSILQVCFPPAPVTQSQPIWTPFMVSFLGECAKCDMDEREACEKFEGNVYFVQFEIVFTQLTR